MFYVEHLALESYRLFQIQIFVIRKKGDEVLLDWA